MIQLCRETVIFTPAERCFDLARSVDFHVVSASIIHGQATTGRVAGLSGLGDQTTWAARFFGLRFSITTEITDFERPYHFADAQCAGLFTHFGHIYTFQPIGPCQTLMTDQFSFQSSFGIVGASFDTAVLQRRMQAVLDFRARALKSALESEEWRVYLEQKERP